MNIKNIIKQPEGRRLEFKEQIPPGSHLDRTVIAFSNDAGGEIYLGVKDEPREIVGLNPDEIILLEERISSMIFDQCSPVVLPEFTMMTIDNFLQIKRKRKRHLYKSRLVQSVGIRRNYCRTGKAERK